MVGHQQTQLSGIQFDRTATWILGTFSPPSDNFDRDFLYIFPGELAHYPPIPPLSKWELAHYLRQLSPIRKGVLQYFDGIFGVMLVCAFCGVFGECVAIAGVDVVIVRPAFQRVGGYGY